MTVQLDVKERSRPPATATEEPPTAMLQLWRRMKLGGPTMLA